MRPFELHTTNAVDMPLTCEESLAFVIRAKIDEIFTLAPNDINTDYIKVFQECLNENEKSICGLRNKFQVWKGYQSELIRTEKSCVSSHYIYVTENESSWKKLPTSQLKYVFPSTSQSFYLLRQFHRRGTNRDAFYACDIDGNQCVIKFSSHHNPEEHLRREKSLWEEINHIETHLITLNRKLALVVPYLQPLTDAEKKNPNISSRIVTLIQSAANLGDLRVDPSECHIGWYQYQGEPELKLLL